MADELMRLAGVGPDNETEEEKRLRMEEFLRAMPSYTPPPQEPDDLPPLPGLAQPPLRPAPELGEFDEPVVVPDAPEVTGTVGGETPIDDVISWLEMTKEQQMLENRPRALEARARDTAQAAGISTKARLEEKNRMIAAALKESPMPSKLAKALVVLTGGIGGHFGYFDKAKKSRAARAAIEKSFPEEWKRIQAAVGAEKSARLSSELISGRARAKAKYDGAIDAVKAMAGMGLTSPQPWVFEGFEPSLATEIGNAFKTATMTFNAIGTPKERQIAQLAHIDSLGKLAYFHTWANDPPKAVLPNWQPQVNEAFANARANAEANQLATAKRAKLGVTEEQSRYGRLLLPRLARVFKLKPSAEVGGEFDLLMDSYANRVTSAASGEALLRELEETEGIQLIMLHALQSELGSDEEKEDLKRFIAEDGDPDKKGWRPAKTFTNLAALKARLKDIGFDTDDADQMQKNINRITRLRDEFEDAKDTHGKDSDEAAAKLEQLSLATVLTMPGWTMAETEGPNGEIVYTAVKSGKSFSIQTVRYANGIAIIPIIDPSLTGNAKEKAHKDAEKAVARIKREGKNIEWLPGLPGDGEGGDGPGGADAINGAKKYMDALKDSNNAKWLKTLAAMTRWREEGEEGLTKSEAILLGPIWPLIMEPEE